MEPFYYVLDTETTGFSQNTDSLLEVAVIKAHAGQILDSFETFVNPGRHIPDDITKLTGICDADVSSAPDIVTVAKELAEFLKDGYPIIGHNISFDIRFILAAFAEVGIDMDIHTIDTCSLSRRAFPDMPDYKLSTLISKLNLSEHPQSHRAMDDVMDTHSLFLACSVELDKLKDCIEIRGNGPRPKRKKKFQRNITSSKMRPTVETIPQDNPLYGKHVVFTGELSIPRAEAAQMVVNCGGVVRPSVSSKTNYLVVGEQDNRVVGLHGTSSKERKAAAMNADGVTNVVFLREAEFLKLIPPECICTKEDE